MTSEAKQAETTETEITPTAEQPTETAEAEKLSFLQKMGKLAQNLKRVADETEKTPVQVAWKDGVTRSKLQDACGYSDKDSGFNGFFAQAREVFKFQTMKVKHNDTVKTGKQMGDDAGANSRSKFIEYCKNQANYTLVRPGIEIPNFSSTRETGVPDALSLLDGIE